MGQPCRHLSSVISASWCHAETPKIIIRPAKRCASRTSQLVARNKSDRMLSHENIISLGSVQVPVQASWFLALLPCNDGYLLLIHAPFSLHIIFIFQESKWKKQHPVRGNGGELLPRFHIPISFFVPIHP